MNRDIFDLISYSFKHGGGTVVAIGDKFYVSMADEKTGHYERVKDDTITLLNCAEVTSRCFERNADGELEYYGETEPQTLQITLRPKDGPLFLDEYFPEEVVRIKEVN